MTVFLGAVSRPFQLDEPEHLAIETFRALEIAYAHRDVVEPSTSVGTRRVSRVG
jgi:hypothetical protein